MSRANTTIAKVDNSDKLDFDRVESKARYASLNKSDTKAKPDFDMDEPKPRSANLRSDTKAKTPSLAVADPKAEPDKVSPKTHVVKANETLFQVAVKYDISMDELKKLNKLSAKDNTIKTGQKLKVKVSDDPKASAKGKAEAKPAPTLAKADPKSGKDKSNKGKAEPAKAPPKTHVVKANETLFQVAVKYDTSVDELKKLNKLSAKDNTIKTGQKLKVSG
jgi:LysM repeat protein